MSVSSLFLPRGKGATGVQGPRPRGLHQGWCGCRGPPGAGGAGPGPRVLSPGGCRRLSCSPAAPACVPSAACCRPPAPGSSCRASPSAGPAEVGEPQPGLWPDTADAYGMVRYPPTTWPRPSRLGLAADVLIHSVIRSFNLWGSRHGACCWGTQRKSLQGIH